MYVYMYIYIYVHVYMHNYYISYMQIICIYVCVRATGAAGDIFGYQCVFKDDMQLSIGIKQLSNQHEQQEEPDSTRETCPPTIKIHCQFLTLPCAASSPCDAGGIATPLCPWRQRLP